MSQDEYKLYELAQEELENNPNKGLLIKLGIECDDDDKKVRVRYIKTRVEHMMAAAAKKNAEAVAAKKKAEAAAAKKKAEAAAAKKKAEAAAAKKKAEAAAAKKKAKAAAAKKKAEVAAAKKKAKAAAAKKKAEEKKRFDVKLTDFGSDGPERTLSHQKFAVIKVVQEITGLHPKEAKELFNWGTLPKTVKEGASKSDAEEVLKKLLRVGAKAKLTAGTWPPPGRDRLGDGEAFRTARP
jgi:ribosomal protein L7/L12